MFIAHGGWIRKHSRKIFLIILVVLVPSFIALFTTSTSREQRREDLPTVGGKPVKTADFEQARNIIHAEYIIGTGKEVPGTAEFHDQVTQEAVVRMLLVRKAQQLGVRVTDNEVIQHIRTLQVLRNEMGQFDTERYRQYMIVLHTRGVTEAQFEEVVRDNLIRARLQELVASAAKVTSQEVAQAYAPLHEKVWIDLVEFNAASNNVPIVVTDDEARAFFEKNKQAYRIPRQVQVRYAHFSTSEAKKTVTVTDDEITEFYDRNKTLYTDTNNVAKPLEAVKDQIRDALIQARADRQAQNRATELTVKLVQNPGAAKPDFVKLCAEYGITPQETEFFDLDGPVPGVKAELQFNQVAFTLTPDVPFSDPVPGEDGYYVLEYLASKPSEIPAYDTVRGKVADELKMQKTREATIKQGEEALAQVKKLVAEGKPFDQACAELKLKVESPAPFTLADEKFELPGENRIPQITLGMATNAISVFYPTEDGGLFFHLKDRQPPDPVEFEKTKAEFAQQVLRRDREAIFQAWVSALLRTERVDFGRLRSRQQQPEPEVMPEAAPEQSVPPQTGTAPATAPEAAPAPVPARN